MEEVENEPKELTEEQQLFCGLFAKYNEDFFKSIFEYCFTKNIFYSSKAINSIVAVPGVKPEIVPGLYAKILGENGDAGKTFFSQIVFDDFETHAANYKEQLNMNEETQKDRQQILSIIGYDPFEKNLPEDKPQLYRDLTGMLTDAMRKDIPKAKSAVEVILGYNNIRKYQEKVNSMIDSGELDADQQKLLDRLLEMITKIQGSVNAINEKNGFSNSKGNSFGGKGTLSEIEKTIDLKNYDEGYVNNYDIETTNAIGQVAAVSNKAICDQIKLSRQDLSDMLVEQSALVHKAQQIARESMEALRLAKEQIKRQELIERLRHEYEKKGINEKDINDFINREYTMWDGKR